MGMKCTTCALLTVVSLVPIVIQAQESVQVEVFYRSTMHSAPNSRLPGAQITLWNLDEPKLVKRHKPTITGTERDVRAKVSDWLSSDQGKAHIAAARDSYRGFGQAMRYRIKKVPAIVLDGEQVVYGTTNVRKALMIYRGNHD
jgi:integrating conjugative element protein (TIGR03757 family)